MAEIVATIASIGAAQGLHTSPSTSPVPNPPKNCVFVPEGRKGKFEESLLKNASTLIVTGGMINVIPRSKRITPAIFRKISVFTAKAEIRKEIAIVNIVKLVTSPSTVPIPFDLLSEFDDDNTIGKRGQMQGARIAKIPDINVRSKTRGIYCCTPDTAFSKSSSAHCSPERDTS